MPWLYDDVCLLGDIFAGNGSLSKCLLSYWQTQSSDNWKQGGFGAQVVC